MKSHGHLRLGRTQLHGQKGARLDFDALFVHDSTKPVDVVIFQKNEIIAPIVGEIITVNEPYSMTCLEFLCATDVVQPLCKQNTEVHMVGTSYFPVLTASTSLRNGEEVFVNFGSYNVWRLKAKSPTQYLALAQF